MKKNSGVTLITLVITIIILLILAGITITQLTESGLFGKAKLAKQNTRYISAKETINLKLMEIQIECREKSKEFNIKETAKAIGEEAEKIITIEKYYNKEISKTKEGIIENLIDLEGIVVSVDEYSEYKFLIGKQCQLTGVLKGNLANTTTMENFIEILEFEENMLKGEKTTLNTVITYEPDEYTNKNSERLLIKITNSKGIKEIRCLDNDTIYLGNGQIQVGIDYTLMENETYTFIVTDCEGNKETKNIEINIFDRVEPKDFKPKELSSTSTSVTIKGNAEDGDETKESAKSGIKKYDYYVDRQKKGETENEEIEITNLIRNKDHTIYLIAYDKAGNTKKSQEIIVNAKETILVKEEPDSTTGVAKLNLEKYVNEASDGDIIYIPAGKYELEPVRCKASFMHDAMIGIFDNGKELTFKGDNEHTILIFKGEKSSFRDGNVFELINLNTIVRNMIIEYYPGKVDNYSNAIFRWSSGTIKNVYINVKGNIPASYNHYDSQKKYAKMENCTIYHDLQRTSPNYSGYAIFTNVVTNVDQGSETSYYQESIPPGENVIINEEFGGNIFATKNIEEIVNAEAGVYYGRYAWE